MALQKVSALGEQIIAEIGHAFGYYDYGEERGLVFGTSSTIVAMCSFRNCLLKCRRDVSLPTEKKIRT